MAFFRLSRLRKCTAEEAKQQLWEMWHGGDHKPVTDPRLKKILTALPSVYISPGGWTGTSTYAVEYNGQFYAYTMTSSNPPSQGWDLVGPWPHCV